MQFSEIISLIDTSKVLPCWSMDVFESDLETNTCMGWAGEFERRMKRIPIKTWVCTDTEVGLNAYMLDEEIVAIGFKPYRKSDEVLHWISEQKALDVRLFILSLHEKFNPIKVLIIDPDGSVNEEWIRLIQENESITSPKM